MQLSTESKSLKSMSKASQKRKGRPSSLEIPAFPLDPNALMMGIVYSGNPNKKNPAFSRYCLSSNPEKYNEGYSLQGMPDGLYVYIKTTADKPIKTPKGYYFPPGTIICREKAYLSESTAHLLLTQGVNLKQEDIEAAGILLKKGVIVEWNLRTGTYHKQCKLSEPDAYKKVGLPEAAYNPAGQFDLDSPKATREMVFRHYQRGTDLPPSLREERQKDLKPLRLRSSSTALLLNGLSLQSQGSDSTAPVPQTKLPKSSVSLLNILSKTSSSGLESSGLTASSASNFEDLTAMDATAPTPKVEQTITSSSAFFSLHPSSKTPPVPTSLSLNMSDDRSTIDSTLPQTPRDIYKISRPLVPGSGDLSSFQKKIADLFGEEDVSPSKGQSL